MQYNMQDQSPICPPHFDRQCCVVNHLKDTPNATLWIKKKRAWQNVLILDSLPLPEVCNKLKTRAQVAATASLNSFHQQISNS